MNVMGTGENQDAWHEIMTIEEVAAYLRLKPQTIYKWAQEKRIPAAKLGKEWRFRRSVIDLWLDEQIFDNDSGFGHLRDKLISHNHC
jgi:excisionase family DNA binding protein